MLYFIIPTLLMFCMLKHKYMLNNVLHNTDPFYLLSISLCICTSYLVCLTEILSVFCILNRLSLYIIWGITDAILIALALKSLKAHWKPLLDSPKSSFFAYIKSNSFSEKLFMIVILLTTVGIIILDLFTAPYNWDSMTYHLPRIMMWTQNQSVNHFATYDVRQIASPYLSEYINLHQYVLLGSDRYFNLIQGFSFCFCASGVYFISRKIGLTRKWQLLSVVLFISAPIIFAEAITTQVDLLTTVWLVIFVYSWLILKNEQQKLMLTSKHIICVVIMAICVGLSYISKPSACIAMIVFLIALLIIRVSRKDAPMVLLCFTGLAGLIVTVVICPGLIRNLLTFGSFSPSEVGKKQLIGTLELRYVILNFVKNICYTLPSTLLRGSDAFFYKIPIKVGTLLNADINHECISEGGQAYKAANPYDYGHDTAINPLIVWLFILCFAISLLMLIRKKNVDAYCICASLSFIVFLTIVRWEPYETRYEISFLTLLCPFIAYTFSNLTSQRKGLDAAILSIVFSISCFSIFNLFVFHVNMLKRSYIRPEGYFTYNYGLYSSWKNATDIISANNYHNIGLHSNSTCFTYPIWVMCDGVECVELITLSDNESSKYINKSSNLDAILWFGDTDLVENPIIWNDTEYTLKYRDENCCLFTTNIE